MSKDELKEARQIAERVAQSGNVCTVSPKEAAFALRALLAATEPPSEVFHIPTDMTQMSPPLCGHVRNSDVKQDHLITFAPSTATCPPCLRAHVARLEQHGPIKEEPLMRDGRTVVDEDGQPWTRSRLIALVVDAVAARSGLLNTLVDAVLSNGGRS